MNFSETTFVLSDGNRDGGFDVRIFTSQTDVPFAGHPILGIAYIIQKEILTVPTDWRLISIFPIGVPKFKETKQRKELSELVDFNSFQNREESKPDFEKKKTSIIDFRKIREPSSAREIEPALV